MRPIVLVVVFAAAGLALFPTLRPEPTHACSCNQITPDEAFDRADSVFVGEVTSYRVRRGIFGWSSIDPTTVKFTVSEVWKGPQQESLTIRSVRSEVSCGFEFKEGLTYLVYAREGRTGLCDRTALTVRAAEDLAALGEGWKPVAAPVPDAAPSNVVPAGEEPPAGGACRVASGSDARRLDLAPLALLAGVIALGIRRRPRL